MDYKQKYEEALEKAKKFIEHPSGNIVEYIFPELKESEDDRIRKEIIEFIENWKNKYKDNSNFPLFTSNEEQCNEYIAWLEKQKTIDIETILKEKYEEGWNKALHQLTKEVDSQIWQIANNSGKTFEESFAILNAAQKAFDKGKAEGLKEAKKILETNR